MEIRQIKGNTWVMEDWQLIPFYKTDEHHCILLDTGWAYQQVAIEKTLLENGIQPVGILGSHIHTDHSGNHQYFQQKYHIPVALSYGEAALCYNHLALKAYFSMFDMKTIQEHNWFRDMVVRADEVIGFADTSIDLCGAHFDILHTPGHSPDHIAIGTPDGVLYLGDACLSKGDIESAKLPYFFSIDATLQTMETLKKAEYDVYVMAHRDVDTDLKKHLDANQEVLTRKLKEIRSLIVHPMTIDQIQMAIAEAMSLKSSNPINAALYARNIRGFVDYLTTHGMIRHFANAGMEYYEMM